jgi:transcriptional regulator with XRE-family HTH domain
MERRRLPGFEEMGRRRLMSDLVARRRAAGMSQTDVAARMGTSQSTVARLEGGEADVRLSTLQRYAAAVGHRVEWRLEAVERGET